MGESKVEIIHNYNRLKRGKICTFIILPPFTDNDFYQKCEEILPEEIEFLTSLISSYDIHPKDEILNKLISEVAETFNNFSFNH